MEDEGGGVTRHTSHRHTHRRQYPPPEEREAWGGYSNTTPFNKCEHRSVVPRQTPRVLHVRASVSLNPHLVKEQRTAAWMRKRVQ